MTDEDLAALIVAAQQAVGAERTDDYIIQPTVHAGQLAATAPALAAILRKAALSVLAEEYERNDKQAIENQVAFKTAASRANWAVFLTACFSALLLVANPLSSAGHIPFRVLVAMFGVCAVISGGLASMWLFQVKGGNLLGSWMGARAAAEALRAQYFEGVISFAPAAGGSSIPLPLLQLEYFLRYQFDVQVAFFGRRAADHNREAGLMLKLSAGAVALASISAGLAVVLGVSYPRWVSIAVLASIATALSSFAATKEDVSQNRRNAERYNNARSALALLKVKLDDVRAAAANGQSEPIQQFVAATHEQIFAEHRQWLAAVQNVQPAIDQLDETLAKLKAKVDPSQSSATAAR
jgi:hypothetical protein